MGPAELKEQMKQRLAGGAGVVNAGNGAGTGGEGGANPDLASFMHQEFLRKQTELKEQKEAAEALQHLSKVQAPPCKPASAAASPTSAASVSATEKPGLDENGLKSDSDSNYKMVIKNGVLMKKQKQRRYRTERPYSCHFCEARFTLRSNMERHIKQQHPQHWCQKPRGSRRNHAATVPVIAPQFRSSQDSETDNKLENDDEAETNNTQDKNKLDSKSISGSGQKMLESAIDEDEGEHDDDEEEEEGFEVCSNKGEDG